MVNIFDTKGIIRIEYDETEKQTVKKYNNTGIFSPSLIASNIDGEVITLENYNSFIKSIEPNLNKILFSRKVVLVEGPNDIMAYKFAIEKKIEGFGKDKKYAETYLNFLNICIIAHFGKATALLLIDLCKHLGLDYFVINDWDFDEDFIQDVADFTTEEELKASDIYLKTNGIDNSSIQKGMITTNWKLIKNSGLSKIHFNRPKLERVLGYDSNDKNSVKIWAKLNSITSFNPDFFPKSLEDFLEFSQMSIAPVGEDSAAIVDDLPF